MGTSTSGRGPGNVTPIVPAWADTDGQGPGPPRPPDAFRGFRTSLGKFVSGGDRRDLHRALGRYARDTTGGSSHGPRRFNAMAGSGGALFGALSALRDGRDASAETGVDLSALNGQDTDVAIQVIVGAITPENGDADRIRVAMTEALSECLDGEETFDFGHITEDMLVKVMLAYVRNCIAQQIVADSRDAFAKARVTGRVQQAEFALRELIAAATDKHLAPLLSGQGKALDGPGMAAAQVQAIGEIWAEWEAYDP